MYLRSDPAWRVWVRVIPQHWQEPLTLLVATKVVGAPSRGDRLYRVDEHTAEPVRWPDDRTLGCLVDQVDEVRPVACRTVISTEMISG